MRRLGPLILVLACGLFPTRAGAWGDEGHRLIMAAALADLSPETARLFAGHEDGLAKAVVEPDKHHGIPAADCQHWIDVEMYDPACVAALDAALERGFGADGWADEDARGAVTFPLARYFAARPAPWTEAETAPLWAGLPPNLEAYRARYGHREIFLGTVVYQPRVYARALAWALRAGDGRKIEQYGGDLGHFVGDLFVPFHATANYKGQQSGNLIYEDRAHRGFGDVHARFEIAYVHAHLDALRRAVAAGLHPPVVRAPGELTPAAVDAARASYALIAPLLAADREATRRADPRHGSRKYLTAVEAVFGPAVLARLTGAAQLLADCLATAAQGRLLAPPEPSSTMSAP